MPELFVSYSRDDTDRVMPLVENLRKLGFDLWIDIEHLTPGTPAWAQAIDDALYRVDGVLAFLSPSAKRSTWCNKETMRAQEFGKPIYPVLLAGDNVSAIPIQLTGAQYADLRARADREANFERLAQTLARDFGHELPTFELDTEADQDAMPTIQNVISGHVEGHVYILNVSGSVGGDVTMAGRDVIETITRAPQPADAPATFDALAVYRQAVQARQRGEHAQAVQQLNALQRNAPDLFPDAVARLIADSEAAIERDARWREYRRAYEHVSLLALDPLTHNDARQLWAELKATYPKIDDDPDGLAETLWAEQVDVAGRDSINVPDVLPPPFEWCEISAGSVKTAGTNFDVQPFLMAKYPVTYAQYQVFLDAKDGFYDDRWWQGLAADAKHRAQPGDQRFKIDTHPRERVSWYDAVGFCAWLSAQLGYPTLHEWTEQGGTWEDYPGVRLPAEWEWQWAAQGDTG